MAIESGSFSPDCVRVALPVTLTENCMRVNQLKVQLAAWWVTGPADPCVLQTVNMQVERVYPYDSPLRHMFLLPSKCQRSSQFLWNRWSIRERVFLHDAEHLNWPNWENIAALCRDSWNGTHWLFKPCPLTIKTTSCKVKNVVSQIILLSMHLFE